MTILSKATVSITVYQVLNVFKSIPLWDSYNETLSNYVRSDTENKTYTISGYAKVIAEIHKLSLLGVD